MNDKVLGTLDVNEHLVVHGAGLSEFFGPTKLHTYIWLGSQAADFTTTGWGATEKGRLWFNSTENVFKYWDGSTIQTLGAGTGIDPDDRNETILETLSGLVAWGRKITYSATPPANPEPRDIWLEPAA